MQRLLLLLLWPGLLSLLPAPLPAVHVVLVAPPGETWSVADQVRARDAATEALDFWLSHAPYPLPPDAIGVSIVEADWNADPGQLVTNHAAPPTLTLVFVNNRSDTRLDGGVVGVGYPVAHTAVMLMEGDPGHDLAALTAHEIGHAWYGLPDCGPCEGYDIMGVFYPVAYHAGIVGCASRASLGIACTRVWAPIIFR